MPSSIVSHFGAVLGNGTEHLFQRLRRIYALFLGSIPKVARISGCMLGIVDFHGPRINVRFQGSVGIGQRSLGKSCAEYLLMWMCKKV